MKILVVHNYYRNRGGEDEVFAAEKELLAAHGHEVTELTETNAQVHGLGNLAAVRNAFWSPRSAREAVRLIAAKRPDVAHVHNTWIMLSPSIHATLHERGIPVVQTLHNYRLLCPNGLFFQGDHACEKCLGLPLPLPGILRRCFRSSLPQSAVAAAALSYHRLLGIWRRKVDCFITLSEFARDKFIRGGLPPAKLVVKPNFLPDADAPYPGPRSHVAYTARLSAEKGIHTLLKAWSGGSLADIPLRLAGDGPEQGAVLAEIAGNRRGNIRYLGRLERPLLDDLLMKSRFSVVPSGCYENFPLAILNSFRLGVPVIASRLGSMEELVRDGVTGLHFRNGDSADLAAKARWLWDRPGTAAQMGRAARSEYERKYRPERNYRLLMDVYERVIRARSG